MVRLSVAVAVRARGWVAGGLELSARAETQTRTMTGSSVVFALFIGVCMFLNYGHLADAAAAHLHNQERVSDGGFVPEDHSRLHGAHQSHQEFDHEAILGKCSKYVLL